jgi:hypothetical protein
MTMSRRARILAGAIGIAVILALSGCVGIPTSGGVNEGPKVSNGTDGTFADLPSGPVTNASKDAILTGFMQAANLPGGDYATAKLFLTQKAATTWNPTASVLVREGQATTDDEVDGTVSYSVITKGSVGADGTYLEQSTDSTQTLSFSFQKVKGQWRISQLADGTVISRNSFTQVFTAYPLYFFDPGFHYLVPDIRWFPAGSAAPTRIVNALLGGPANWLSQGSVVSAFPQGVSIGQTVAVHSNSATVDLSSQAASTDATDRSRMLQQLDQSLLPAGISNVSMTAHGAPLTVASPSTQLPVSAVNGAPLIERDKKFGYYPGLASLGKTSSQVVALDGSAAVLGRDQATAAVLTKVGVYLATGGTTPPILIDSRPDLIAPSIDPSKYVWTVPSTDASAIRATSADGIAHTIESTIPRHATVVSLDVSHDGTRILIYLKSVSGPRLIVAGIIRHDGVPTGLGPLLDLPVSTATPIDATWVDATSVATLAATGDTDTIVAYLIGGSPGDASTTTDAAALVGGSELDTLRLITVNGQVQQLRSSGWQDLGVSATILATQQ